MGLIKFFSSSSYDDSFAGGQEGREYSLPNPDPSNYTIEKHIGIRNYTIVQIIYHDCTNYEGRKILVYKDCTIDDLKRQDIIDPHFSENKKYHSPIARFEPTENGWTMAVNLITTLT